MTALTEDRDARRRRLAKYVEGNHLQLAADIRSLLDDEQRLRAENERLRAELEKVNGNTR